MRHVREKVAFFQRQLGEDVSSSEDPTCNGSQSTTSLAESTASFQSKDLSPEHTPSTDKPGAVRRIYFVEDEEKPKGLASKGSSDIWSMFPKDPMGGIPSTHLSQGGRHAAPKIAPKPTNIHFQTTSSNASTFYSRHNQGGMSQALPDLENRTTGISSTGYPPPLTTTRDRKYSVPTPPTPTPARKFDRPIGDMMARPMGGGDAGRKRTWGVANGNRTSYAFPSPTQEARPEEDESISPRLKRRLSREQINSLEAVVSQAHESSLHVDDSGLPRPAPAKGTPDAKLQYAQRMQAGYLRSTGRGSFVPKPPSKWGYDNT